MTVLMVARFVGDAHKLEMVAKENRATSKAIAERAKAHGLIRHRFFGTDSEIIAVDEWPTADDFEQFFKEQASEIMQMMGNAGVTAEPSITIARALDVGDEVG